MSVIIKGVKLESCRSHAGVMQESCWSHAGVMQKSWRSHAGVKQESCWIYAEVAIIITVKLIFLITVSKKIKTSLDY